MLHIPVQQPHKPNDGEILALVVADVGVGLLILGISAEVRSGSLFFVLAGVLGLVNAWVIRRWRL